jgi:hypothetical protein
VDDNILVGNREAAASRDLLMYYGVTHVRCVRRLPCPPPRHRGCLGSQIINATLQVPNMFPDDFLYCNLRFEDNEETNISAYFKRAIDFMKDAHRENRRVLVHCVAGASRSVTLVVAYLMCVKKQRLDDSLAQVCCGVGIELVSAHVARGTDGVVILDTRAVCPQVQKLRFVAQPNNRFLLALATLEVRLFGWSSVATSADKQWNFLEWNRIKSTVAVAPARPRAVCVIM